MCPSDDRLILLVSGEMTAQERHEYLSHLQECEACHERYAQLQATWSALGEWQPAAPPNDMVATVLGAIRRRRFRLRWATAAAAVLVAASAGLAAGLLTPRQPATTATRDVAVDQAVQAAGLDAIAADPDVFAPLILADPQTLQQLEEEHS